MKRQHESRVPSEYHLPEIIPVFPLRGAILLPYCVLPLNIFEPRYLAMVRDTIASDGVIGMIQPRPSKEDQMSPKGLPQIYGIGGAGRIRGVEETDDGRLLIELVGLSRFQILEEIKTDTAYRQARVDWTPFMDDLLTPDFDEHVFDREVLLETLDTYLHKHGMDADFESVDEAPDVVLVNSLSMIVPLPPTEKQALVEAVSIADRAQALETLMDMAVRTPETSGTSDLN